MGKKINLCLIVALTLAVAPAALATNGDNLIGIGPISRAMGGAGIAAPQDAISAIFANPAAMCFGPFCPGSSVDFAGTFFKPTVNGKISSPPPPFGAGNGSADSELDPFIVPAVGITMPINNQLRFGVGMWGVSGLGVDYKRTDIPPVYTQLQVMKFAPNLAYLITPNFSVGASIEVVWQNLDLGEGSAHGYALGGQLGALYHLGMFNIGVAYITPEKITHQNVSRFGDPTRGYKDLDLESPHTFKFGVSFEPDTSWLFEAYTRWYNWSDAAGYEDFDWDDQWVFGFGTQWKATEKLSLRLGYNYGKNPVKEHNGWNPGGTVNVQGTSVNRTNYETLRIIGFPAIVEHHFTAGIGYRLTDNLAINLSAMYAPENNIDEKSDGGVIKLKSELKEWSSTFGISLYF